MASTSSPDNRSMQEQLFDVDFWECEEPNCDHRCHNAGGLYEPGYLPLSIKLGVLQKITIKDIREHLRLEHERQVKYEDVVAAILKVGPCVMYHCTVCNVIVDTSFMASSRHCDTLEHRRHISRLIPGQETMLPQLLSMSNKPLTLEEEVGLLDASLGLPARAREEDTLTLEPADMSPEECKDPDLWGLTTDDIEGSARRVLAIFDYYLEDRRNTTFDA